MSGLQLYRVSAVVGDRILTLQTTGWHGVDALERVGRRLRAEGHHAYTLSILESKEIQ